MSRFSIVALLFFVISSIGVFGMEEKTILFLGDSLTEGYGINKKDSYPEVVKQNLEGEGLKVKILNGSVSGSTTASSMGRLKWFLKAKPDILFLALGANDGLRGIKVSESKKNLEDVITRAQENGLKVVVAGMMVPPNYGPTYSDAFKKMYKDLGELPNVTLLPFLLEGVAGEKKYNQEDGIHPNEEGHKVMGKLASDILLKEIKKGS